MSRHLVLHSFVRLISDSLGTLVEFDAPPCIAIFTVSDPITLMI